MGLIIQMGREDSDSWIRSFVFTDEHKGGAETQSGSEKVLHAGEKRNVGEELWIVLVKCLILCWRGWSKMWGLMVGGPQKFQEGSLLRGTA